MSIYWVKKVAVMGKPRIAYVVNHAAFFVSHRIQLAVAAKAMGFNVQLFIGQPGSPEMEEYAEQELSKSSIPYYRTKFKTSGINPLVEFFGLCQLIGHFFRFKPSLVHCASPKGVLYGGLAARLCGIESLVLAISGMGFAYTTLNEKSIYRTCIKGIYLLIFRIVLRHENLKVIVQNKDDYKLMVELFGVNESKVSLIQGSGVHIKDFEDSHATTKEAIVLLPGRMLRDKGVVEFVNAARRVKSSFPSWRFILAGASDYKNPTAIGKDELQRWNKEGVIEWIGHVNDMSPLFSKAAIVCLPSYREGMPKALLEAGAASCAIVTTNVTGCRDAIEPGETGDLVPAEDSAALAKALISLIEDRDRRFRYGINGRYRALKLFSIELVIDRTLKIYKELLRHE